MIYFIFNTITSSRLVVYCLEMYSLFNCHLFLSPMYFDLEKGITINPINFFVPTSYIARDIFIYSPLFNFHLSIILKHESSNKTPGKQTW